MSRKGILFAALVALMLLWNAGLGRLLSPLLYTLTPLQRYYLPTYMASAWDAGDLEAQTEVRWIFKVRPEPREAKPEPGTKGKPKRKAGSGIEPDTGPRLGFYFAGERDLRPKPMRATVWSGDALPFVLSGEAEREGWTGLEHDETQRVASGKVYTLLRQEYFDGSSWESFFVQPALALAMLVVLGLMARAWLTDRRERRFWGGRFTKPAPVWRWMFEAPERRRVLPGRGAPRAIEAAPVAALPPPQPRPSAAAAPPPATATATAEPKTPFVWDESMGID